jgi:hypothetical protein
MYAAEDSGTQTTHAQQVQLHTGASHYRYAVSKSQAVLHAGVKACAATVGRWRLLPSCWLTDAYRQELEDAAASTGCPVHANIVRSPCLLLDLVQTHA